MPRPCHLAHPEPVPDACHLCHLYIHDDRYRRKWDVELPAATPRRLALAPCRHLGPPTGETVSCRACGGRHLRTAVYACRVHGTCVLSQLEPGRGCCNGCPDRDLVAEADPLANRPTYAGAITAETAPADLATVLPGGRNGWPADWPHWGNTAAAYRLLLARWCRQQPDLPYPEGQGRAVITCAGGWRFLAGVYTQARVLRQLGWPHPIQVWYLGSREYDPCFDAVTRPLGVEWVDAVAAAERLGLPVRRWGGWEAKSLALLLAPVAEVLFLDADCYPERNPEYLFDDPRYREKGAIFWPDRGNDPHGAPLEPGQWVRYGLPPRRTPGLESGQILIDRRRCRHELEVARWLNDHSDYVYATGLYGDKDTFSIAWHAVAQAQGRLPPAQPLNQSSEPPYVIAPPTGWTDVAFRQKDLAGVPLFVHRCRDKPRLPFDPAGGGGAFGYCTSQCRGDNGMVRSPHLPLEGLVHQAVAEVVAKLRPQHLPSWEPGTDHEDTWREVALLNVYRLPERIDNWRVVDVGAHIGLFANVCLARGAAHITCVEPNPDNLRRLLANLTGYPVAVVEAAAWPEAGRLRLYRPTQPGRTNCGYVLPDGGPAADTVAVALDPLLAEAGGPAGVDLLKLDCEGAEWELLARCRLPGVRRVAGEYHLGGSHDTAELRTLLARRFNHVEVAERGDGVGSFFAWQTCWF